MLDDKTITGWNATDQDPPVPAEAAAILAVHRGILHPQSESPQNSTAGTRMAAFLGVSLVFLSMTFTLGIGTLLGDITGGNAGTTVEITAEGYFSPNAITLNTGDTFTLTNKNADPQVIKSTDERELFPVQVLFNTDFVFIVPSDASGTFTYFSETLPDDKTLTITITGAAPVSPAEESLEIPLPFDDIPTASVSSSIPSISVEKTEHSGETATISLAGNAGISSSEASVPVTGSKIPTNPYTVGSSYQRDTIAAAVKTQNLHSGAPLDQLVQHKPRTVTQTGPEGALMLLLPAFIGVALLYRKLTIA